mgnify:CR=1 FL=1
MNQSGNSISLNKKNFARKFAEQQATKRFIQPDQKKTEKNREKGFDKAGTFLNSFKPESLDQI